MTAERDGDRIDYVVSVIDTTLHQVIRGDRAASVTGEGNLLDRILTKVVELLEVALTDDAQAALRAGGTSSAEASALFAQGLRVMPYQTAQTKLERHDQQDSLEQAIELFSRAIELDPAYAHAYAGLGEAYLRLFRLTRNPEHFKLADAHCQAGHLARPPGGAGVADARQRPHRVRTGGGGAQGTSNRPG